MFALALCAAMYPPTLGPIKPIALPSMIKAVRSKGARPALPAWSEDEEAEIEDAPGDEAEATEEAILDQATAARTIAELETEITTLRRLEGQAAALRRSRTDTKWTQLNDILDHPLMTDANGNRRKLIVFTEPRDTLNYLADRIRTRLGRPEAVVIIHGGIGREDRRKAVEAFTHDKEVLVLVANDAAGEGINLQRAHLMVNYDLPWNPNRLEQRFGRIHRIGQRRRFAIAGISSQPIRARARSIPACWTKLKSHGRH